MAITAIGVDIIHLPVDAVRDITKALHTYAGLVLEEHILRHLARQEHAQLVAVGAGVGVAVDDEDLAVEVAAVDATRGASLGDASCSEKPQRLMEELFEEVAPLLRILKNVHKVKGLLHEPVPSAEKQIFAELGGPFHSSG